MAPPRSMLSRMPASGHGDAELSAVLKSTALLAAAANRSARIAQEQFGLSGAQLFVLRLLAEASAQSVNDLAARTGTHQSTVSVVVTRLVTRGLVSRAASDVDGRRVTLSLTRAGRAIARRAPESVYGRLEVALRRLPARERRQFARTLSRVVDELSEVSPAGRAFGEPQFQPRIARRDRRHR
jgi:DNA-binding MarR family transcriptional regulator